MAEEEIPRFDKYFDETYKRPYYFDRVTEASIWQLPEGVDPVKDVVDHCPNPEDGQDKVPMEKASEEKAEDKEQGKKVAAVEESKDEVKEYQAHIASVNQMEREALEQLYPDMFLNENVTVPEMVAASTDGGQTGVKEANSDEEGDLEDQIQEFHRFKDLQVHEWMQKPARRQVNEAKKEAAYEEGNYDYNIWYDKYLTDRNVQIERAPSLTKLRAEIDTGYTKADHFEKKQATYFCVYFARGACTEGVNCRYYHRVPQREDLERAYDDNLRDIFGRARHATHKDNLSGIGSFNKECRTLLISRIKLDPSQDRFRGTSTSMSVRDIVRLLYENFSPWGEIDDIYFNQGRFIAYIKFAHRFYSEFARESMHDQVLVEGITDPIRVQWALESPLDKTEADVAGADVKAAIAGPQRHAQPRAGFLTRSSQQAKAQDPHMKMSVQERVKLAPGQLVPQLPASGESNFRKRDAKSKLKQEAATGKATKE